MNLSLKFNNTFEYKLPPYKDEENNTISISLSGTPPINAFITLVDKEKIVINANQWTQLGTYKLNISLSDF
jgi:hypothetical protein